MKYFPYGECRNSQGDPGTDRLFTGQRFDSGTGLYYYGARYYDPVIGRFVSPDTIIPNPSNPQCFNRYTYCMNNPLKYVDPSGNIVTVNGVDVRATNAMYNDPMKWLLVAGVSTVAEKVSGDNALLTYGWYTLSTVCFSTN
jgi:RHS repeat-associated protein